MSSVWEIWRFGKYSRTCLCCYFCFRTLTTHFRWVENCTSTVLIKVWPVITVEVVCFMTLQIRSTYFDFFECTYGSPRYRMVSLCINCMTCIYFIQQIKNHGRPVQNLMNKALRMSALYSTTQPSLLPRSAVVWSWTCWWKQKSSYHWNVLHCQDLKLLPLITKAKRSWHESDTGKFSVELNWIAPQPRTKPVEAHHKNSLFFPCQKYFFSLSSYQKWKPSPKECPFPAPPPPPPPAPLSNVV